MARYKIEFEADCTFDTEGNAIATTVDTLRRGSLLKDYIGTVKATRLPDPPIKQRFIVEIESPSADGPTSADAVKRYLEGTRCYGASRRVTVTPG